MKYFMIPVELTDAAAQMSNAEFRDAMFSLDAKLDEMAVRLGIARRLVADYRKDKKIPRSVAMATRYLLGMTPEHGADLPTADANPRRPLPDNFERPGRAPVQVNHPV